MRLLAIEQTRSPQGKLRLRFDSGEAMLVLPAVVADLSLRPGMDIRTPHARSLRPLPAPRPAKGAPFAFCPPQRSPAPSWSTVCARRANRPRTPGRPSNGSPGSPCSMTRPQPGRSSAAARQRATARHASGRCSTPSTSRASCGTRLLPSSRAGRRDRRILQKRFRGRQPDRTEIRRAADALLRRGHAWGDIRRALERYDPDFPEE